MRSRRPRLPPTSCQFLFRVSSIGASALSNLCENYQKQTAVPLWTRCTGAYVRTSRTWGRKRVFQMLSLQVSPEFTPAAPHFSPHDRNIGRGCAPSSRPMYAAANMGHPSGAATKGLRLGHEAASRIIIRIMSGFEELLEEARIAHGHLCAGQVLGVRLAMLGCARLGIEEPRGRIGSAWSPSSKLIDALPMPSASSPVAA